MAAGTGDDRNYMNRGRSGLRLSLKVRPEFPEYWHNDAS